MKNILILSIIVILFCLRSTMNAQTYLPQDSVCDNYGMLKAPELQPGETGLWTKTGSSLRWGEIAEPENNITGVSDLAPGNNCFTWTVSNGFISTDYYAILVNNSVKHHTYAGEDQTIADMDIVTLYANPIDPERYETNWSIMLGKGKFEDFRSNHSMVMSVGYGKNIYRWHVKNRFNGCEAYDDVLIGFANFNVDAGADQYICGSVTKLQANEPYFGKGKWSVLSGNGKFENDKKFDSRVVNLFPGENRLRWTITAGELERSDNIIIYSTLFNSYAGPDEFTCDDYYILKADSAAKSISFNQNQLLPVTEATGSWDLLNKTGNAYIEEKDSHNPNAIVYNLNEGKNLFRWRVTQTRSVYVGKAICVSEDTVVITKLICSAKISVDKSRGCSPLTVQFTGTSGDEAGNYSYKWDFDDEHDGCIFEQNPVHVFSSDTYKKYKVTLIIHETNCNKTDTAFQYIEVSPE